MFRNLGVGELLVILAIILVLFGANKVPEIARSLGRSIKEFKKGMNEKDEEPAKFTEEKKPEEKK